MKHLLFLFGILLLSLALISCGGEKKAEEQTKMDETATTAVSDTSKVECPGCGMVMMQSEMIAHEINGETKHFCNEACRDNYLAKMKETKTDAPPPPPPSN